MIDGIQLSITHLTCADKSLAAGKTRQTSGTILTARSSIDILGSPVVSSFAEENSVESPR